MNGVSLLETIIVIALITTLSTMGINNFISFKDDATIDNITSELISDIKLARSKSINGELIGEEKAEDFDMQGLPEYGLNLTETDYKIIRRCLKADSVTTCETEDLESIQFTEDFKSKPIDSQYKLSPNERFFFNRITGETSEITLIITNNNGFGREITISDKFLITVDKI